MLIEMIDGFWAKDEKFETQGDVNKKNYRWDFSLNQTKKDKKFIKNRIFSDLKFVYPKNHDECLFIEIPKVGLILSDFMFVSWCMKNLLVDKDGNINGKFSFVRINNKIMLVPIESSYYKLATENEKRKNMPKLQIKEFEFEPGKCYIDPKNNISLFIGYGSTIRFNFKSNNIDLRSLRHNLFHIKQLKGAEKEKFQERIRENSKEFSLKQKLYDNVGVWFPMGKVNSWVSNYKYNLSMEQRAEQLRQTINRLSYQDPVEFPFKICNNSNFIGLYRNEKFCELPDNCITKIGDNAAFAFKELCNKLQLDNNIDVNVAIASLYSMYANLNYIGFTYSANPVFDYLQDFFDR